MALTLGNNNAAFGRSLNYLNQTKTKMDKVMLRLSSGKRINSPGDDPGGLALSMKLQNEITIMDTAKDRVSNAKSYVEMQDTALSTAGDILDEMSSVKANYDALSDKSSSTAQTYAAQFRELQVQLGSLKTEKINGVSLFSSEASQSKTIYTSSAGENGAKISLANLDFSAGISLSTGTAARNLSAATTAGSVLSDGKSQALGTGVAISISQVESSEITTVIDQVASMRANVGGKMNSLGFTEDYLSNMSTNLEAANSRIMDADIAQESINYSKLSIQYEAAAAAIVQANLAMGVVLDLLTSGNRR
jgi:flagellin